MLGRTRELMARGALFADICAARLPLLAAERRPPLPHATWLTSSVGATSGPLADARDAIRCGQCVGMPNTQEDYCPDIGRTAKDRRREARRGAVRRPRRYTGRLRP